MKKITFYLFLFVSMTLASCSKDTEEDNCTEGTVRFSCTSSNPYNLYIDNVFQIQLKAGESKTYTIKEGTHKFFAEQVSGYILYPTTKTENFSVFGCKTYNWSIP